MQLVPIVYVGPFEEVEVDGFAEFVVRGEPVEVPASLAGRPPHGHRVDDDFDPGEGLLAQDSNWWTFEDFEAVMALLTDHLTPALKRAAAKAAANPAAEQAAADAGVTTTNGEQL